MYCDGYKGRLRTTMIALVATKVTRLHENHQVDLKVYGLRTIKVL